MRIISRNELCKYPNGTVFMIYKPEITDGEIHIKTGANKNLDNWNGELTLTPIWEYDTSQSERFCQWSTIDTATCDYDESQMFMVFSKTEVHQMINALMWSLTGCQSYFNEDVWICGDTVISDEEMESYKS